MKLVPCFLVAGFRMAKQAGFKFVWATIDNSITPTLKINFPRLKVDERSISCISAKEIPDCDGIIGGPPCQLERLWETNWHAR